MQVLLAVKKQSLLNSFSDSVWQHYMYMYGLQSLPQVCSCRHMIKIFMGGRQGPVTRSISPNDIKTHRIEQSGLVDHLHKGLLQHQWFEHKLECLPMTLIDQVVGEIITDGICKLCELEKEWINRLQTFKELNDYNDHILNRGCPHKRKVKRRIN